jgi:hypothetical protein
VPDLVSSARRPRILAVIRFWKIATLWRQEANLWRQEAKSLA